MTQATYPLFFALAVKAMASQQQQTRTVLAVPTPGWIVRGFHYSMWSGQAWHSATIFLANSPDSGRCVQFWWHHEPPSEYHGNWTEVNATLYLSFNGRGLAEGRRCHDAFLMCTSLAPLTYEGHDYALRKIIMKQYASWVFTSAGCFQEIFEA